MASSAADPGSPYRLLHEVAKRVHSSLSDLPATLDAVARGVVEATCFGVAVVNLVIDSGEFQAVSVQGDDDAQSTLLGVVEPAHRWMELIESGQPWGTLRFISHHSQLLSKSNMTSWVPPTSPTPSDGTDPDWWHPLDTLLAPLYSSEGDLIGALSVDLPEGGRRPQPEQLQLLELFADHAALAIEHARLHRQLQRSQDELRHAATHDGLTGLLNRSGLLECAAELRRDRRCPVAVIVLDLDGFKAVNDLSGHRAGDAVLVAVSGRMQATLAGGGTDVLARTGGDEFVIIRHGANAERAAVLALCAALKQVVAQPIPTERAIHAVGVSLGWARSDDPGDFDRLLAEADARMYGSKPADPR
ncbi:diguanylate cyclase [Jatrophihabitans sp.]|uniref:diguanylate cyclase domain-containing protein n=1 Tax=Jatrophihabitans sp. TaxID=1932789 RepID=UPI0030C6C1FB|nr:sensor-containing diguanylate cyclase [Jatrophihabitans sp.]